jgi:hypothetical protein
MDYLIPEECRQLQRLTEEFVRRTHFTSHGDFADCVLVIARAIDGGRELPMARRVEHGAAGFSSGRRHRKVGERTSEIQKNQIARAVLGEMFD